MGWGYFQGCCSSLVRDYVYQRGHRSLLRILTYFLVMLCKFLLERNTWHPNGLKSLNVVDVILNFGHLIHVLHFDVLEKDPAWIAHDLCWACASWCLDTVSNPGRKALPLVQRAQLWPAVYQKMDARTLKTGKTIENKIDWSRNSGFGDFNGSTRFKQSLLFFFFWLSWCHTERFATTIFSGTQRGNVGTMLQLFETMLQLCVALKIVVANRPV